jgi:hypothetical protein
LETRTRAPWLSSLNLDLLLAPPGYFRFPGSSRRSQEEPGAARRSQEGRGGARRSQEEPGGASRSNEEPGARSQESRCKGNSSFPWPSPGPPDSPSDFLSCQPSHHGKKETCGDLKLQKPEKTQKLQKLPQKHKNLKKKKETLLKHPLRSPWGPPGDPWGLATSLGRL